MDDRKAELYESATRKLLRDLDEMLPNRIERLRAKNFVLLFRDSFKLDSVKHATFSPIIGNDYKLFPYDSYGFCRAATFSFIALMNSPDWKPMYIDEIWYYGPHYYIMHMPTKRVLDITYDQYTFNRITVPYEMGHKTKIDGEGPRTVTRFLHAAGIDFMDAAKNAKSME